MKINEYFRSLFASVPGTYGFFWAITLNDDGRVLSDRFENALLSENNSVVTITLIDLF